MRRSAGIMRQSQINCHNFFYVVVPIPRSLVLSRDSAGVSERKDREHIVACWWNLMCVSGVRTLGPNHLAVPAFQCETPRWNGKQQQKTIWRKQPWNVSIVCLQLYSISMAVASRTKTNTFRMIQPLFLSLLSLFRSNSNEYLLGADETKHRLCPTNIWASRRLNSKNG